MVLIFMHCVNKTWMHLREFWKHLSQNLVTILMGLKYVNFGGGHHITREDYDVDRLIEVIRAFKARHNDITVYLEPGEAVGWQTGPLVASVLGYRPQWYGYRDFRYIC